MVYRFKYDDDDSSLINKQQLASSDTSKNGSDTITAKDLRVKDLDNKMWIMNGSRKEEAEAKNTTTTITESSSNGGYPTPTESSSSGRYLETAKKVAVVGALGGAAFAAGWGLYCLLSSSSSPASEKVGEEEGKYDSYEEEGEKMKAPGKEDEYILREDFERNPQKYFQDLRKSKRKE